MAMRAPSSPGCGVMHMMPTSAVSSACKISGGASRMGRGPKSSSKKAWYFAPRSSRAAARLAATGLLTSSAIKATHSPLRTARQVSTAFLAPGISSFFALPNKLRLLYFSEFLRRSSKVDGLIACAGLLGNPLVGACVEEIEGKSSSVEHFVVKRADVELGAEFCLRAVA